MAEASTRLNTSRRQRGVSSARVLPTKLMKMDDDGASRLDRFERRTHRRVVRDERYRGRPIAIEVVSSAAI
jgi:hypothetical protein